MEMCHREDVEQVGAESCAKGSAEAFAESSDGTEGFDGAVAPKKRGRPRKHLVEEPGAAKAPAEAAPKKQGRPRKHPVKEEDVCGAAFRRQGRPPKNGWKAVELLEGEVINGAWEKVAKLLLQGEPGMSIREIAKEAKISRDMVYRYLKDEGFNRYLDALIDEEIKGCEAAIWHRLKEMCLEGDLQAIKYYFELRGKREKEPQEGQGTVVQIIDDVPDLSPEELKEIYGPLAGEELRDDAR